MDGRAHFIHAASDLFSVLFPNRGSGCAIRGAHVSEGDG